MDHKPNEIKAGLMIVVSIIIMIIFLVAIFGVDWGSETKSYRTYLKNIPGITIGSLVKYGGMNVGTVTEIGLPSTEESKIRLMLEVDAKTPVRTNSVAFVTSIGIMADNHIEISSGSLDAPMLPGDSELGSKEVLGFTQMAEPLGDLNDQLMELLDRVSAIFDERNRQHLTSMLGSMDTLLLESRQQFQQLGTNLDSLTANLAALSSDINQMMARNQGTLDSTFINMEQATGNTAKLLTEMQQTIGGLNSMMSANSASLIEIMENFQFASQNFEEFSRILKERPWLLVRKSAPPERKLP